MSTYSRLILFFAIIIATFPAALLAQQWPAPVNFGTVAVGSSSQQTVTFTGMPANTSFSVYTGTEFSVAPPNCSGSTCTVQTTFSPAYPGLRQGAITATGPQGQLEAVAFLWGAGTAPQIAVGPGVISTVASRATYPLGSAQPGGVVVGGGGYVLLSDSNNGMVYSINTSTGQVVVVAGTGTSGYSGDGGKAPNAQLNGPTALALNALGDIYIADTNNNVVRKVSAFDNTITTVAGTGAAGNAGDGGAANQAQLNAPRGVAVDAQGNLYIADSGNNRVREVVASNGQITGAQTIVNFAGSTNGTAGYSGDSGLAVNAALNQPRGMALDASGNLFIADFQNEVIREVTVSNGHISTVAGVGQSSGYSSDGTAALSANLNGPASVAVDAAGNLYITEQGNELVRKITNDPSRPIYTIAGSVFVSGYSGDGGSATIATVSGPNAIALDAAGNVFFVDYFNHAVREISASSAPLIFPPAQSGTVGPLFERLANTGNTNLVVSSISVTSPYSETAGTCGSAVTLTPGATCTVGISFTAPSSSSGAVALTDNSLNQGSTQQFLGLDESAGLRFVPLTPCRLVDTRYNDAFSGSYLTAGSTRTYTLPSVPMSYGCNIPNYAAAYALNVAVLPRAGTLPFITLWPNGPSRPVAATLSSYDGRIKSVASIVGGDVNGAINVYANQDTELVLDIEGYFVASGAANYSSDLEFYPVTPCRVVDTRGANGTFGGPALVYHGKRDFPVQASSCSIPSNATAYSINVIALPSTGSLSFMTAWPTGQTQPTSAVVNAPTGTITANAAIIQAGNSGDISVYSTDASNLVIDINGYFAPPTTNGLSFYPYGPCRVLDTRSQAPGLFSGSNNTSFPGSSCNVPGVGQAYVVNATVLPNNQPFTFLALWPQGTGQPAEATLNALDGAITNNLAIVPTSNGSISEFQTNQANLVLDIFGYFAP